MFYARIHERLITLNIKEYSFSTLTEAIKHAKNVTKDNRFCWAVVQFEYSKQGKKDHEENNRITYHIDKGIVTSKIASCFVSNSKGLYKSDIIYKHLA
jgi:hypothetical protein